MSEEEYFNIPSSEAELKKLFKNKVNKANNDELYSLHKEVDYNLSNYDGSEELTNKWHEEIQVIKDEMEARHLVVPLTTIESRYIANRVAGVITISGILGVIYFCHSYLKSESIQSLLLMAASTVLTLIGGFINKNIITDYFKNR